MTVEQMKKALGAVTIKVFPAKDKEGNRKYNTEGDPLYKFLGYDTIGNKIANGYVSKELGKLLEKGEVPHNVEAQYVEEGVEEPFFMLCVSNSLAEF